jgi:hypothetical protein
MSKVWVLQENRHNDYAPAQEWGEVEFITKNDLTPFNKSASTINFMYDLGIFLSKYVPGVDFIIPTGNPIAMIKMGMELPVGEHKFLKWDQRRNTYYEHRVSK